MFYNGGIHPPKTLAREYVAACVEVSRTTHEERVDRLMVAPASVLLPYSAARHVSSFPFQGLQPAAVMWLSIAQLIYAVSPLGYQGRISVELLSATPLARQMVQLLNTKPYVTVEGVLGAVFTPPVERIWRMLQDWKKAVPPL